MLTFVTNLSSNSVVDPFLNDSQHVTLWFRNMYLIFFNVRFLISFNKIKHILIDCITFDSYIVFSENMTF